MMEIIFSSNISCPTLSDYLHFAITNILTNKESPDSDINIR